MGNQPLALWLIQVVGSWEGKTRRKGERTRRKWKWQGRGVEVEMRWEWKGKGGSCPTFLNVAMSLRKGRF